MAIKGGLRSLLARPLLFLLPFYMTGLSLGPHLVPAAGRLWPLAALATLVFALWVLRQYRFPLAAAAGVFFLIGLAASANLFRPPTDTVHVYQYRNKPGLIFGGRITQMPWRSHGRTRLIVSTREVMVPGGKPSLVRGRVYLSVQGDRLTLRRGDWVRFPATLRTIEGFSNPGGFNYQAYWVSRGVWIQGYVKDPRFLVAIKNPGQAFSLLMLVDAFRNKSAHFIDQTVAQPARGLLKTLLLGIRDDIEPGVEKAFRRLGLAHLLAISGLHIGLIGIASYWLCSRLLLLWPGLALRLNVPRISTLVALGPVLLYTAMAGGRPSTIRAAVMVGVFALAFLLSKSRDFWSALAAAAWVILIFQPGAVFSISFQLSFTAAAAIFLLTPRLAGFWLNRKKQEGNDTYHTTVMDRLSGLASITLAATLGTAPIVAYHFNQFPLLTLPANLVITPLITLICIPLGLLGITAAFVFPWLGKVIFLSVEKLIWVILAIVEGAASWSWVNLTVPGPGPVLMIGYYLLLLDLFLVRPFKKAFILSILIIAACIPVQLWPAISRSMRPELTVTMLDVGQGNAAHVSFPDQTEMIIDGGGFSQSKFDPGEKVIAPYLLHNGVTRIDILVLSHVHPDHCGGLAYLAQAFRPAAFWSNHQAGASTEYWKLYHVIKRLGINSPGLEELYRPRRFGSALVQVLHPPPNFLALKTGGDKMQPLFLNNNSLVLKIQCGKFAFLFPGDLEKEGEAEIVSRQKKRLRADVLLASHHGGKTSLTPAFLEAVRPRYVVFSVGRHNRFRQPSPEVLARVRAIGAVIYRTDINGAVTFTTDGKRLRVKTCR